MSAGAASAVTIEVKLVCLATPMAEGPVPAHRDGEPTPWDPGFVPHPILAGLQGLAQRIFGAGDRAPHWLARKWVRECVDPGLSWVAMDPRAGDVQRPETWLGYVLAGAPASRAPRARTVGTGVVAEARGQGIARALHAAVAGSCRAAGHRVLELWSEAGREPVYRALGFVERRPRVTLLSFARGAPGPTPPAQPWDLGEARPLDSPGSVPVEIQGFLAEAWERSPAALRSTWPLLQGRVIAHVMSEGRALVVHRTVSWEATPHAQCFEELLDRLPAPAPVLAVAMDPVSPITADLAARGWREVQASMEMELRL